MKRAIVFGSTGGMGQQIAHKLASDGWSLYLHYNHNQVMAEKLASDLMQNFPKQDFFTLQFDFARQENDLGQVFGQLFPVNALIFAHGITDFGLFGEQSDEVVDQLIQVNLTTPLKIIKYFEPMLLKNEHSRIILFGSVYGHVGSAMETIYSTVKGALSSFANAYAKEVASASLTINVIAPGAVETPMIQNFTAQELANVQESIPAGRLAKPDDIAYWVQVITDEKADYFTGQTIYVDGGWLV